MRISLTVKPSTYRLTAGLAGLVAAGVLLGAAVPGSHPRTATRSAVTGTVATAGETTTPQDIDWPSAASK